MSFLLSRAVISTALIVFFVAIAWTIENRRRRRHSVPSGFQSDIELPFEEPFELYHNALSLCSMKSRLCMAELQIPYKSHHIDLIETGFYENIRAPFLRVNPAGTVPVLVHEGHPIYESHEQIRYAARFAPDGCPPLLPNDPDLRAEMEEWIDRSSLTKDPVNNGHLSAGNAAPGQTLPLFAAMIEKIPFWKIFEGLLFHFDKLRPMLFTMLKLRGIDKIDRIRPVVAAIARSRNEMGTHLDAFEEKLAKSGGPWLLGDDYSLADVSWLGIFERLRQADAIGVFMGDQLRPETAAYWSRLQARPAYREAILDQSHPLIEYGRERIVEAKAASEDVRLCLEGSLER
jgi:glutathione S-transferase